MHYLLDTAVLVWALDDPEHLPAPCRKVLLDGSNHPLGLSAVSLWEIAHGEASGRFRLNRPLADWIAAATRFPFVSVVAIGEREAVEAARLPGNFQGDFADRVIVATARIHGLTVLSAEKDILGYPHVRSLWK
jgi:PIN domain nuclease of toxin-antitoxin system